MVKRMMFNKFSYIILVCFIISGCNKKYNRTVKVCGGKLYVEIFDLNPIGVSEHHLTDSANFRLFVGEYDNEHDLFSYRCEGDTITIFTLKGSAVTAERKFSLSKLRERKS
jgi:hypothetical protein